MHCHVVWSDALHHGHPLIGGTPLHAGL